MLIEGLNVAERTVQRRRSLWTDAYQIIVVDARRPTEVGRLRPRPSQPALGTFVRLLVPIHSSTFLVVDTRLLALRQTGGRVWPAVEHVGMRRQRPVVSAL